MNIRGVLSIVAVRVSTFVLGTSLLLSTSVYAGVPEGTAWLATQQNASGAFGNTATSLATNIQSTAEVLRTYQALNQSSGVVTALSFLNASTDDTTETLARKILVNAKAGNNVNALVGLLIARLNADGGFGDQAGNSSSVLNTAYVLEALNAANVGAGTLAISARSYLLSTQQANGGWADGDNTSSAYLTALCIRALTPYQNIAAVSAALTKAQNFVFSQRGTNGSWGQDLDTALVLTALIPVVNNYSLVSSSVNALQANQLSNGSWLNDSFTTALAIQALKLAQGRQDSGFGSVNGYVLLAGSSAPIAGATVVLSGAASVSVQTNGDGYYLIPNVASSNYTVAATKTGYSGASTTVSVQAGGATLAGDLILAPATQTALVRGIVFDATTTAPLVGVSVSLSGNSNYSALTDAAGRFDFSAVVVGGYTLTIQKSGYSAVTSGLSLTGGQSVVINQGLRASGAFQDTEPGTVNGTVVNALTGAPIAGATVSLGSLSATSGTNGGFSIGGVSRGSYSANISASGFTSQTYVFSFTPDSLGALGTLALYPVANTTPPSNLNLLVTVVDGVSRAPIGGAIVTIVQTGTTITTGTSGQATFSGLTLQSFTLALSASGYQSTTYPVQAAGFGNAQVTIALSPPGSGTGTSTLRGTVTNAETNAPVAGARVSIDGTTFSVTTGSDGTYNVSGINLFDFSVSTSAVGFQQQSRPVHLEGAGTYTANMALQPITGGSFQIISIVANQSPAAPNGAALFTARIANAQPAAASVLVMGQVLDSGGRVIANVIPYVPNTTVLGSSFNFASNEIKVLSIPWNTGQFASGQYTLVLRVMQPDSISQAQPLGVVLAEGSAGIGLSAQAAIDGALAINPPVIQSGSTTPINFTAAIRNAGNVSLQAGGYNLTVSDSNGAVLYTAQANAGALDIGAVIELSFAPWAATQAGNLNVTVKPSIAGVGGQMSERLYVGNAATGSFTLDKTAVPAGTQTVRGTINVQGVDPNATGAVVDPMLKLVQQAIIRAGQFTAPEATNFHKTTRCLACHTQTQAVFGLASSIGKASVDEDAAKFLYNVIASDLRPDNTLRDYFTGQTQSPTALGLWSLGAWPEPTHSFRTKYLAASYLYSQKVRSGDTTFWRPEAQAWWNTDTAQTALVVVGFADLLRNQQQLDMSKVDDYVLGPELKPGVGAGYSDIEVGPDGAFYLAGFSSFSVVRFDPVTNQASTVIQTGAIDRPWGIAFGPDGALYVAGRDLRKVLPGNQTELILSDIGTSFTDVEAGPDGWLYVSDYSRHRILRVNTAGQSEVFVSGGLINNPRGLAFDATGNLYVANSSGYNILKIAPDKTVSVHVDGLSATPIFLDITPAGEIYASTLVDDVLFYRIRANRTVERASFVSSLRGVVVKDGQVWVTNAATHAVQTMNTTPINPVQLATFRDELPRAARYFLNAHRDNINDNVVQALRLWGLAEIRSVTNDAALKTELDGAIAFIDALLRSRQRTDGGWSRTTGNASDSLVTAMVGIALDYSNPSPSDPVVRKTIQRLLTTQGPDGAWTNTDNGLSTKLGATSFVMAYLPKAFDRLAGIDADLRLNLPSSIQLANPTLAPSQVAPASDGGTEYLWNMKSVNAAGRNVAFDLTFADLQPNETRPAAREAYLTFANPFTTTSPPSCKLTGAGIVVPTAGYPSPQAACLEGGAYHDANYNPPSPGCHTWSYPGPNGPLSCSFGPGNFTCGGSGTLQIACSCPSGTTLSSDGTSCIGPAREVVRQDLTIPNVTVANAMALALSTDRTSYGSNQPVTITSSITSVSSTPVSGQVLLSVQSADGNTVTSLPPLTVSNLAPGATVNLTGNWNTGTTLIGGFRIHGQLLDEQGRTVSQATTAFSIAAPSGLATTSVTTDKPVYSGWDTVQIVGRVKNVTANAILPASRVEVTVRAPGGAVLLFDTRNLTELVPGGLADVTFSLRLADAVNGSYAVELVLKNEFSRDVLSTASASFQVDRQPTQGITGSIVVNLATVNRGDPNVCNESAKNISATALTGVKLIHQFINMDTNTVLDTVTETVDLLPGGQVRNYFRNINTAPLASGGYACALKAEIGGEIRTLAFGGFRVTEPPIRIDAELKLGTRGRLLVLLDNATHCTDNHHGQSVAASNVAKTNNNCVRGHDPHGPQDAPLLGAQRAFLEGALRAAGWSYTITERDEDFAREFRSGRYTLYAILAEQEKLSESTQKQLREAVFRGEGLVVAGSHDARHNKLLDPLGIKLIGQVNAIEAELAQNPFNLSGHVGLLAGDKNLRIKLAGAQSVARYRVGGNPYQARADEPDCCDLGRRAEQGASSNDNERNECDGGEDRYLDAVTINSYGRGRSLFAGFDLMAIATRDGSQSLATRTLLAALDFVNPAPVARLGGVVPVQFKLTNRGMAVNAVARVVMPSGASIVDAGGGTLEGTPQGPSIKWTVALPVNGEKELVFYMTLPLIADTAPLHGTVSVTQGNTVRVVAETDLPIIVEALVSLESLADRARALAASSPARRQALLHAKQDIEQAAHANSIDKKVNELLHASDRLLGLNEPAIVALRADINEWLRYTLMLVD